jgi:hypothetical protein
MKIKGPIVTLLVGLVIAVAMLIVSSHAAKTTPNYSGPLLVAGIGAS